MKSEKFRDRVIIKQRMLIIFSILFFIFFILIQRLGYVMIFQSENLKSIALEQWTSEVNIDAKRGRILDRNGIPLAISANVYRVDLNMNTIRKSIGKNSKSIEEYAKALANALDIDFQETNKKMNQKLNNGLPQGAVILARRIEKSTADKVEALKIQGVMISPDTKRYYPNNNFLAHVLGFTDIDGKGLYGIEAIYDEALQGIKGKKNTEIAKNYNEINSISNFKAPIDGKDVYLTIDATIQQFAEKAAEEAIIDNKAKSVSIIISDPNNGEILAMVNKPDYNPNNPKEQGLNSQELNQIWRNRAVNDTFEPGSVFKVVTTTAAMEQGLVTEEDAFDCSGVLTVANRKIHCWKRTGHGHQKFIDILKNSCNVGFMTLGNRLGREKLNSYIKKFGFGQKTGIDLNGEAKGIVKATEKLTEVDVATLSFGQVDTVSCIQYLTAFNAIANGGKWIRPHVMKEIASSDENNNKIVIKSYDNYGIKQILDPLQMEKLRSYLEKVVSEGGGNKAYAKGYKIAGKTGTAQKPINGVYVSGKYVSSFGGMAPYDNPKITMVISIDEPDPSNYYAGQIVAPIAKEIFCNIFNYLGDVPEGSEEAALKDIILPELRGMKKQEAISELKKLNLLYEMDELGESIIQMEPLPGATVKEGNKILLYTGEAQTYNKNVIVPDLIGLGKEKAENILKVCGLKVSLSGEGIVMSQDVCGREVEKGSTISLQLGECFD